MRFCALIVLGWVSCTTAASAPLVVTRPVAAGADIKMSWVDYSYVFAGFNLCNNATGVCRTLSHWVYTIMPADPLAVIVSGASFSLDDGPYLPGQPGNFESHICNGQCGNTSDVKSCTYYDKGKTLAQVWNWGYDAIYNNPDPSKLPKKICIQAFAQNVLTKESGKLPPVCNTAPLTVVDVPRKIQSWKYAYMYSLSAEVATFLCTKDFCRTNAHNSWDVSVPDPTDQILSVTHYSIDGGDWLTESGATIFEQKVKDVDGTFYHTFSWNYDVLEPNKGQTGPKEICFKVWVSNRITSETAWVDLGKYGKATDARVRCLRFCDHVNPFSYAPEAGGYCA